jgi:hypothetical protein
MSNENDLMTKLMISKKIMEKHDTIGRGGIKGEPMMENFQSPMVEEFKPVQGNYNIPSNMLEESTPNIPQSKGLPTNDRILQSKLPDEIKQLMIENPIVQPSAPGMGGSVISDELIEKASRLMNSNAKGEQINKGQRISNSPTITENSNLRDVIKETVEGILRENGLLIESTKKSKELFKFKVGQHLFEGVVTKISKIK